MDNETWLTIEEAAQLLPIPEPKLRRWISRSMTGRSKHIQLIGRKDKHGQPPIYTHVRADTVQALLDHLQPSPLDTRDLPEWIDLDDAARLLNLDPSRLRKFLAPSANSGLVGNGRKGLAHTAVQRDSLNTFLQRATRRVGRPPKPYPTLTHHCERCTILIEQPGLCNDCQREKDGLSYWLDLDYTDLFSLTPSTLRPEARIVTTHGGFS